jgi:hypothetical protein
MRRATIGLVFGMALVQAALSPAAEPVPGTPGTGHPLDQKLRHTDVSGKLEIGVSEPFFISNRAARPELGTHIFPALFKMPCGSLQINFNIGDDLDGIARGVLQSSDQGKTWTPMSVAVHQPIAVGVLRDGAVLLYDSYAFIKEGNTSVGQMCVSRDGGRTFGPVELATFNRPDNVASRMFAPEAAAPYKSTSAQWSAKLTHALYRRVLEKPDGTLIAPAFTQYEGDKKLRTICYHSTDKGRTWGSESTVAYDPKIAGEGFCEPVMAFCSNGDVLCVMRTNGWLPLMQARSTDGGKTWQPPTKTGSLGVDPDLCLMSNGVLACSYGRPGNWIMFSVDGTGRQWTDRIEIWPNDDASGYTGIVEIQPGKLLYVYNRKGAGAQWGIDGVLITVRKAN